MTYWMTTHWPPTRDEPADAIGLGVWVPDGREQAGADLAVGDTVFIYQSRSGRTLIETRADGSRHKKPCHIGREGVVAVAEVAAPLRRLTDVGPEVYTDGTSILWCWHAPLSLRNRTGFLPRRVVVTALGYKPSYNLRGFGDRHSGLKKLDDAVGAGLLVAWSQSAAAGDGDRGGGPGSFPPGAGGESAAHLDLKEYVAAHPTAVLAEAGVELVAVEQTFPTADRADVVLRDRFGTIVGVEIEVDVRSGDFAGPLQAIKYSRMLELTTGARHGDSRAVLVAYTIAENVRQVCSRYQVQCIEVPRREVEAWRAATR